MEDTVTCNFQGRRIGPAERSGSGICQGKERWQKWTKNCHYCSYTSERFVWREQVFRHDLIFKNFLSSYEYHLFYFNFFFVSRFTLLSRFYLFVVLLLTFFISHFIFISLCSVFIFHSSVTFPLLFFLNNFKDENVRGKCKRMAKDTQRSIIV